MAESLNSTGSRLRMAFGWYCVSAALQFGSLNESLVVLHHAKGHSKAQPRSHAICACACARACACAMSMCVCRTNDGVRIVMHTPGDDLFSRRRGVALLQGGVRPRNDLAILLAHTPGRACTGVELHVRHGRTATGTLSRETNFRNSPCLAHSGRIIRRSHCQSHLIIFCACAFTAIQSDLSRGWVFCSLVAWRMLAASAAYQMNR